MDSDANAQELLDFSENSLTLVLRPRNSGPVRLDLRERNRVRRLHLTVHGNSWNEEHPTTPVQYHVNLGEDVNVLTVRMVGGQQAAIQIEHPTGELHVRVSGPRSGKRPRLQLLNAVIRTLSLERVTLIIEGLPGKAFARRAVIDQLDLSAAEVEIRSRNVSHLRVLGKLCTITAIRTPIGELICNDGQALVLRTVDCRIGRYSSGTPRQGFARPNLVLLDRSSAYIKRISDRSLVVQASALLFVETMDQVQLWGPGSITVREAASGLVLRYPAPLLHTAPHRTLVDLSGSIRLGIVTGSSISGSKAGGNSSDVAPLIVEQVESKDDALRGVSLSDVSFPVTLEGISVISALSEHARHVSPRLGEAPQALGFLSRIELLAVRKLRSNVATTNLEAEYARAIASLADAKGAPASTRAILTWRRYRMRNLIAPGAGERALLSAYRLLGYGEKFSAPFLLYVLLVVLMNAVALSNQAPNFSLDGLRFWFAGLVDWAVTPLHLLRLTSPRNGEAVFPQPWDTVARLLIAIPFGTAILVLRKYVKDGSGSGGPTRGST